MRKGYFFIENFQLSSGIYLLEPIYLRNLRGERHEYNYDKTFPCAG